MLTFARPYWKRIVLSMVLSALIVAAVVAQPRLIQIAIDDRINGLYKPMIALDASLVNAAVPGRSDAPVVLNGKFYWRADPDKRANWPSAAEPAQIVRYEGKHYLLHGWSGDAERLIFTGTGPDDAAAVLDDGTPIPAAALLSAEQVDRFRQQDYRGFIVIAAVFLLTVIASGLLAYWQSRLLSDTGQQVIFDIRARMFEHLTRLSTAFFDRNPVGRLVTRVAHDVEALNQLYSQVIVNLAKELLTLAGIVGVMLYLNAEMALVSFTVIPLLVVVTFFFKGVIRDAQRRTRAVLSRLNSFLAENLSGMSIVQIFTRETKQLERFTELNEEHYRAGIRGTVLNSIFNPTVGFIGNIALALIIWYGGSAVLNLDVNYGVVYAFTVYVRQFFQPLMALAERYTQIQTAMASAERIFELLDEKPAIVSLPGAPKLREPVRGEIEFDRVWFAYNPGEWVLKDIRFRIRPGETVAFVGATGAGKSSIINLINRFYDVQQGAIRLDGQDVRELDLEDLRRHIGVIQQDPFVFTGNVYDNIRLNRRDIRDEEIRAAARALKMDAFIERLPRGFETPLGEQGIKLSSGQQQLLAFLRAYIDNPSVLILDEATAHVDTETEQIVQEGLARLSAGRTTLIVAHRLSTIRHADKIIVMHKGQIQEIGNHETLMELGGIYRRLYELQNSERGQKGQPTASIASAVR
jgi:ATP-binding cassette subfamily B protein